MQRLPTRTSKARRWIEASLLLAGVMAIGIWAWSYVRMAVFQSWGNHVLDQRADNRPATASPSRAAPQAPLPPPVPDGALLGRLAIPRLNLRAVVREGAGQDTLDVALGHIPGTALPGQPGNAAIAGHRDTLFRGLRNIEKDDAIEFQTPSGSYHYKVETTGIVKPKDVGVLRASRQPELTLVTCYPFYYVGSAPDRFIVKARLVDPAPAPVPQLPTPPEVPKPPPPLRPALPTVRKVVFQVTRNHSRELAPGIRLGLSSADAARHRASLWMFVTPERRTISLKNQAAHHPVSFHGHDDGKRRELTITRVTANSVSGYLLLYGRARAAEPPLRDP